MPYGCESLKFALWKVYWKCSLAGDLVRVGVYFIVLVVVVVVVVVAAAVTATLLLLLLLLLLFELQHIWSPFNKLTNSME